MLSIFERRCPYIVRESLRRKKKETTEFADGECRPPIVVFEKSVDRTVNSPLGT